MCNAQSGVLKNEKECSLGAAEVTTIHRSDLDDLAFLDEERNLNNETRLEGRRLLNVARSITFDTVSALYNLEGDGRGKIDGERTILDEENIHLAARSQIILHVTELLGSEFDLLEGLGIYERIGAAINVAKFKLTTICRQHFDRVCRGKALVQSLAVAEVAHLDLHKSAEVARRAMLGLHDEVSLVVELDYLAFADVVCCRHDF